MPKKRFYYSFSSDDKDLFIEGPKNFDLSIIIDHDDVDHDTVEQQAQQLCEILNQHWPK